MNYPPVYELLVAAAKKWPANPAVYDEHGMLNFGELYNETEDLRLQLKAMGIKEGMGIGVMAANGRNFIIGIFAAVGCGAAVMPMSPQLKKPEIDDMLEEAKLHAIIDDRSAIQPLDTIETVIPMKVGSFRFGFTAVDQSEIFAPFVNSPAFMRFTSGTTGKSKGVIVSHRSVIERIDGANKGLELGPTDTVIWVLPMAYHFMVSIVLYIKFGTAIAVAKDFLAKNIIDISNIHNGTLLYASPVQIRLLANDTGTDQMPSLKKVISTSAGISPDVCKAFKKRFNIDVSQAYGIIEIGLPMLNYVKSAEYPDAVGYALPGYTVDILDDNNNPMPDGSTGILGIKGPGMFDAYLLPPALRADVLKNGYFLTADYASKSTDGLIKIEGRSKSVINISGLKIFPEEVEAVLEMIPEIKLARISSSPHPLLGQIIEAEVVLNEGATIDVEDVLTYCRKRLSNFKAPQRLKIVKSLPMTGSGKLQRLS
ncbi:MAG TPA: class I adenylate-forming enzyme family protein [Ferruginibacter sp.]|nr:class I adenylate-forming enzyme family protein [Ferruginibacter sp.]